MRTWSLAAPAARSDVKELRSARVKLSRAKEHLQTLDQEIASWNVSSSNGVRIESNAEGTEHYFIASIKNTPDVNRWSSLIGDCAHNLRSALDHIVWEVCSSPSSRSEYPIFANPVRGTNGALIPTFVGKIRGIVETPIKDFIEKNEPCNGPPPSRRSALWVLHRLDIVDKHKAIVPCVLASLVPERMDLRIRYVDEIDTSKPPPLPAFVREAEDTESVVDGSTILTVVTPEAVEHIDADIKFPFRIEVDLRDPIMEIDWPMPSCPPTYMLGQAVIAVEWIIGEIEKLA